MRNKVLWASSLVLGLGLSGAANAEINPDFDIDGGGVSDGTLLSFDWFPGNFLAVDSTPTAEGLEFKGYYQAELTNMVFDTGTVSIPVGATGAFEYTAWAELEEFTLDVRDLDGDGFNESVAFSHQGGVFEIWYDDFSGGTVNADDITANSGTGYRDGIKIFSGTVQSQTIAALYSVIDLDGGFLDQFGADNLGGVQTVRGFGSTDLNLFVEATEYDHDFFITDSMLSSMTSNFDATLKTPFDSVNPSTAIQTGGAGVFTTPNYGPDNVNGFFIPGVTPVGSEDFHFESDGNQSFKVPEPASLALLGMGLAFFGMSRKTGRRT